MVTNDATILRIKHEILYEVAKLAWNDRAGGRNDDDHSVQNQPWSAGTVPLLRIQGERDYPSESPPGRGQMSD